jgi:hypothetical protein
MILKHIGKQELKFNHIQIKSNAKKKILHNLMIHHRKKLQSE